MKDLEQYRKYFKECLDDKRTGKSNEDMLWITLNQANNVIENLEDLLERIEVLVNCIKKTK